MRKGVHDTGDGHFHAAQGRVDAEQDDHEKEADGPERRAWYGGDCMRVDDIGKTLAGLNDVVDVLAGDMAQVAHVGEDDESGEKAGQTVGKRDEDGVSQAVVVELVVGGER